MENNPNKKTATFPFKTLIWVLFASLSLFIFKNELKLLIGNAEELTVFGIEIKAGKEKAMQLELAVKTFKNEIKDLSNKIESQQTNLIALKKIKEELESEIAKCPETEESVFKFNEKISQIYNANEALQVKTDLLNNMKIIKTRNLENAIKKNSN